MHARNLVSGLALGLLGTSVLAAQTTQTAPNAHTGPTVTPPAKATVPAAQKAQPGPNAVPGATAPTTGLIPPNPLLGVTNILVYDTNSAHGLAATAATNISPGGTTVAGAATFNTQLTTGGPWDVVLVDCPSSIPTGAWTDLINYVNGGGKAAMSFWDWDNSSGFGDPALTGAFDVSVSSTFSLQGQTLFDSGTSSVFAGVTMPNSDWHDHWVDDGDNFTPQGSATGIGHLGNPATPCMVLGNGGTTIAAQVIDEAGDTWLGDGSGVQLWENLFAAVAGPSLTLTGPTPGIVGVINTVTLSNATPGGLVGVGFSLTPGSTPVGAFCPGLTVDLDNPTVIGTTTADASGSASFSGFVPASLSGTTVYLQGVDIPACEVTNLVSHTFP